MPRLHDILNSDKVKSKAVPLHATQALMGEKV
jgi:hypothetical protein